MRFAFPTVALPARRILPTLALLATVAWCWWDFWPNTEHQDLLSRSIDIAMERYPDMAAEIGTYRDDLLSGTHDEDFDSDEINGSYSDYSGYCPSVPDAWWPTATRPLNAVQWVHDSQNPNNWAAAVAAYETSRSDAYYMLGHILHNMQDMLVPAHSHISPHGLGTSGLVENHSWPGYFDNFEQWCEVTDNELNLARPERIPAVTLDSALVGGARLSSTDAESAGFYPSQYHAAPDAAGEWGRYRPFPSGGYPCGNDRIDNDLANSWSLYLVPLCCEYAAAALRDFYVTCNPVGAREHGTSGLRQNLHLASPTRPGALLLDRPEVVTISFFDASGRVRATATGASIRCPDLPAGVYLCRVAGSHRNLTRPLTVLSR